MMNNRATLQTPPSARGRPAGISRHRWLALPVVLAGVVLAGGFWLTRRDEDPVIWGHYGRLWFTLAITATLMTGLAVARIVRHLLRRSSPRTKEGSRLSFRKRLLFTALMVLPVLLGAELWLRHMLREAAGHRPPVRRLRADASYHALLQVTSRAQIGGRWQRVYAGRPVTREKSTRFRIVCLGGSTTRGAFIPDQDTWPFLLEEHLRSLGYDVEVINAGQPWYTTAHSLTNYAVQMRYLDPDVVVVMHAVNDLCRSFPDAHGLPPEWDYGSSVGPMDDLFRGRARSDRGAANAYRPPLCAIWTFICAVTEVESKYYSAFRTATEEARGSHRSSRTPLQKRMPGGTAPLMDRAEANIAGIREVDVGLEAFTSLESFRSHLDYLVELAQADGALVMVCTQAHMYGRPVADWPENMAHTLRYEFFRPTADTCIAPDSLRRAMAAARDIIVDIAHLRGALLLDAEALIHDDASCFLDDFHLVREGNDRIARAMADRLAPALNARSPSRDVKAP